MLSSVLCEHIIRYDWEAWETEETNKNVSYFSFGLGSCWQSILLNFILLAIWLLLLFFFYYLHCRLYTKLFFPLLVAFSCVSFKMFPPLGGAVNMTQLHLILWKINLDVLYNLSDFETKWKFYETNQRMLLYFKCSYGEHKWDEHLLNSFTFIQKFFPSNFF